jgi:hypothetical protein
VLRSASEGGMAVPYGPGVTPKGIPKGRNGRTHR